MYGVILVGFDHAIGPILEFAHPPELLENVELQKSLPFLSLPDGSHTVRSISGDNSILTSILERRRLLVLSFRKFKDFKKYNYFRYQLQSTNLVRCTIKQGVRSYTIDCAKGYRSPRI